MGWSTVGAKKEQGWRLVVEETEHGLSECGAREEKRKNINGEQVWSKRSAVVRAFVSHQCSPA